MNLWRVTGVLCLIGIEALLYGYSYPFFSLALEKRELANWLIGLNASLAGAGILIVGPILPRLIVKFGVRVLVASLFAVSLLSFGAILLVDYLPVWFLARFVMGTCFAALWTSTEIWLNGVVNDRHRGRIIGASGTLYATCQFLGPLVLGGVGVAGSLPLIVAMVPLAVGVIVALSIRPSNSTADDEEPGLGDARNIGFAVTVAGGLVAAAFLGGIGETAMQSLLPLYGLAHGLDDAGAARLVAIFSLGEAVLIAGLGWMADRYGRRLTLRLCVLVATVSTLAIPFSTGFVPLFWLILFFSGGTVAGIYTLGIVLIGQDFRGQKLAVVSTGFAMAYAAGSIVGSSPVGYLIDVFGPEALPISVGVCFLGLATYLFLDDSDDKNDGTTRELHRAVPNLTYLEDSHFDEDAPAERTEPNQPPPTPEASPALDSDAFKPVRAAGSSAPKVQPPADHTPPAPTHGTLVSNDKLANSNVGALRPVQVSDTPNPVVGKSVGDRPPEDDLEDRFRRRSAEIAENVAKREKTRGGD